MLAQMMTRNEIIVHSNLNKVSPYPIAATKKNLKSQRHLKSRAEADLPPHRKSRTSIAHRISKQKMQVRIPIPRIATSHILFPNTVILQLACARSRTFLIPWQ